MFLLIDNYDSFTYNLMHYLGELGVTAQVHRNDALTAADVIAAAPQAIVISPGPGTPDRAGICLDVVAAAAQAEIPLLGVCLGHQSIAQHFGATIVRNTVIMHGKMSGIAHDGSGVFAGLPEPLTATRYHSLVADPATIPNTLRITARCPDDGSIMGLSHAELPIHGVQFHPESYNTVDGHALLANFIAIATGTRPAVPPRHAIAPARKSPTGDTTNHGPAPRRPVQARLGAGRSGRPIGGMSAANGAR